MKLLEYYREVVTTVGLTTTEDDYLSFDGKEKIEYNNLPIAMPTKEHLKNIKELDMDTMEMVVSKHIFNPLSESLTDGLNPGMSVLINKMELFIGLAIEIITYYLIRILADQELQKNLPIKLIKFMSYMANNSRKGVRTFTTKDTEKNISGVFDIKDKVPVVKTEMIENATIDGKTYRHVLDVKLPLYETITNKNSMRIINKNKSIEGAKVVPSKDLPILRAVHDFLFDSIELTYKTNNTAYPTYILYMEAWLSIYGRINDVLKSLRYMEPDNIDRLIVDITLTKKEITPRYLKRFNMELSTLMVKDSEKDKSRVKPKLTGVKKKKVTQSVVQPTTNVVTPVQHSKAIEPIEESNNNKQDTTSEPMSYIDELKAEMINNPTSTYAPPTPIPQTTPYNRPSIPTPMYSTPQPMYGTVTPVQPVTPQYPQPMGAQIPTPMYSGQQQVNPMYPNQQQTYQTPQPQQFGYNVNSIGFR